jgi:hypothetical protein
MTFSAYNSFLVGFTGLISTVPNTRTFAPMGRGVAANSSVGRNRMIEESVSVIIYVSVSSFFDTDPSTQILERGHNAVWRTWIGTVFGEGGVSAEKRWGDKLTAKIIIKDLMLNLF